MDYDKIKKFFAYLRTVQISESLKTDYTDSATYFKTSELPKRLLEMEAFINGVIEANVELQNKVVLMRSKALSLENDISILQKEKESLIRRLIELKN